ncbi:MAG: GntR family transcriptional regulator [Gaiellaceae bacterium]
MVVVKIDRTAPGDLHEQVAAEIRRAIADGEARPGERLPPAGDLAAILDVNKNTVLRALRALRDEGLLEFRRGRGVTVNGTPGRGAVVTRVHELLLFARRHGYGPDELVEMIEQSTIDHRRRLRSRFPEGGFERRRRSSPGRSGQAAAEP